MPQLDVTHVTAPAPVGGSESVVAALTRGLAGRGHRVRLIALLGTESSDRCLPFESLPAAGVDLREVRLPPRSYRRERREVAAILGESETIAHCHGYHADLIGWRAGRQHGRPLVSTVHGFTGGGLKNRVYEWLDHRALGRFDAVVAVSAPLRERLADALGGERVHLIPNAFSPTPETLDRVAARAELGLPAAARVVGFVGRLTEEKGPDLFLDAFARLPEDVVGSVVGSGRMGDALAREAGRAGLDRRVRWHGTVPAAARVLRAFDVLVLSSRTEGTPIVLFEAMACGVPVVATRVGGVPDVVSSAEAVVVSEPSGAAIARGIQVCLDDRAAADARAIAAQRRLAEAFALDPWLDRHEALYRRLS